MKRKLSSMFLCLASVTLLISCSPAASLVTSTPELNEPGTPILSSESFTLTAAIASTLAANPSSTSPAGVTIVPAVGDLGWGAVYGVVSDATSGLPIDGAIVRCEHYPYSSPIPSPYPCYGTSQTNNSGIYSFGTVFFRETDGITLLVDAPGYAPLRFTQDLFTIPELHADLVMYPLPGTGPTPTDTPTPAMPMISCTAPVCTEGVLTCGSPNGCPGGCGTICQLPSPTP